MWHLIFIGTTIIFAWLWFVQKVANATLLWYFTEKNIPFPSDEEMKKGAEWVTRHFLDDLLHRN